LTRNFQLLNTLYRSHWIIRKIIDLPAEDMCKNWYQINTEADPEALDKIKKLERTTGTKASILKALKWGRLYGGAAGVIMIKGHEDYLEQPLSLDDVLPGSYCGLLVLDRWSGITPAADAIDDINSRDFGLPRHYRITVENGKAYEVHSSRVLRFTGRDLPFWEKQAEVHWGLSEVELVFDELKKRDNTSWNIAGLVFLSNIRVLKLKDLAQTLATQNTAGQQRLYNVLQAQNHLMSNMGLMALNSEDEFQSIQYSGFRGLSDIHESFMLDICGAAEIPIIKLFGRSPSGIGDAGRSDLQTYYDSIEQKQEAQLEPAIDRLLPIMAMSAWGEIPADLDHAWNPPQTASSDELANIAKNKSDTIIAAFNSGLISQRTGMQELRQLEDETGLFSNIRDEDIAKADEEIQQQGEMGGMMGGEMPPGQAPPGGGLPPGTPGAPGAPQGNFNPPGAEQDTAVTISSPSDHLPMIRAMRQWIRTYRAYREWKTSQQVPAQVEEAQPLEEPEPEVEISDWRSPKPLSAIRAMRKWIGVWLKHKATDAEFNESEHPRDEDGKFGSGGGGGEGGEKEPSPIISKWESGERDQFGDHTYRDQHGNTVKVSTSVDYGKISKGVRDPKKTRHHVTITENGKEVLYKKVMGEDHKKIEDFKQGYKIFLREKYGIGESEKKTSDAEFNESDHPRGQPKNAGQFTKGGGGSVEETNKEPETQTQTPPTEETKISTTGGHKEPETEADGELDNFFQQFLQMFKGQGGGTVYKNSYDLVAKDGQFYKPQPRPKDVEKGKDKECYRNAALLAMGRKDLTYVEGFATIAITGGLPFAHAWCVDKDGNVIDPTWVPEGTSYRGVPFSTEYLRKTIFKTEVWGLIPDMPTKKLDPFNNGYPEGAIK
jgi:phage-related protein (TIGR01555 family)